MAAQREVMDGTAGYVHDDSDVAGLASGVDFPAQQDIAQGQEDGLKQRYIQTSLDFQVLDNVLKEQGLVREEVMNHLLFHKALIGEEEHYERINKYIEIVDTLEKHIHLTMGDIYDQSLAITFELVIENKLDPWDVDLIRFSKLYLERAQKEGIDLVSAGRIILLAWTILKLQSKELLRKAELPFEEPQGEFFPDNFDYQSEQDLDFTQRVMFNPEPPIHEMVWRKGKRPVTLIELVDAFEEARRQAEMQKIYQRKRDELRVNYLEQCKDRLDRQVHKDYLEEDIKMVWDRISKFNGHPIPFNDIWAGTKVDWIVTLRSLLFLANRSWITVWQDKFPYGEIYIKNIHRDEPCAAGAEGLPEEPADPAPANGLEAVRTPDAKNN